ncbi:hypothetical protein BLNAU_24438 [Blattamonas nauphoetae]|uniref:Uncharacterized protein n=1 Tax=Blattamonas nauphoetae TaxID=2049346 RepID=A0ABQ9WMF0_9EUKA|nr:hypothetical protein BLNAU_24438 [Blattamonas nauphoetae]
MMECRDAERMIRQEFVACLGDTLFQVEGITQPVLKSLGGSTLSKNDAQIMMSFVMSFGRSVIENVVIHVDEETDAKDEKTTDKSQILTRTENLVSRLISREIDIGVTAFITETTPLRKEGRRKGETMPKRLPRLLDRRPFPLQRRCSHLAHHPHSKLTLPPSPFNKSLLALEGRVELSNVPFVWEAERGLVSPSLAQLEHSSSRHLRSLPPINLNSLSLSSKELILRLKKVDFSNVKNGASDAVRIFVMGAGPLSFSPERIRRRDCGCESVNEADKHLKHALPSTIEVQTSAVLHSELDLTHDITKITSGSGEKGRVDVSREGCLVNQTYTPLTLILCCCIDRTLFPVFFPNRRLLRLMDGQREVE